MLSSSLCPWYNLTSRSQPSKVSSTPLSIFITCLGKLIQLTQPYWATSWTQPRGRVREQKRRSSRFNLLMLKVFIHHLSTKVLVRRNFSMMVLCFAGFLSYEEVANLKFGDVIFCDTYLKAFIEKSKTDQCRLGALGLYCEIGVRSLPSQIFTRLRTESWILRPWVSSSHIFQNQRNTSATKKRIPRYDIQA